MGSDEPEVSPSRPLPPEPPSQQQAPSHPQAQAPSQPQAEAPTQPQPQPEAAPRPEPAAGGFGPLDAGTLRPMATLVMAKIVAMFVVFGVAVAAVALLVPQVADGLGLARPFPARITALAALPAADNASVACERMQVQLAWGAGEEGTFTACGGPDATGEVRVSVPSDAGEQLLAVGDSAMIRAISPWRTVSVGARWPNTVLALVLALLAAAAVVGMVRYVRERRALARLGAHPISAAPLAIRKIGSAMAFDVLTMGRGPGGGRGQRATVLAEFESGEFRRLRVQVPGATREALDWEGADLHATGRNRRGLPAAPYVLRTPQGTLIATGRALRPVPAGPSTRGG